MSRHQKSPLRPLLEEEREQLMHWSRGQAIAASPVARAKRARERCYSVSGSGATSCQHIPNQGVDLNGHKQGT
jgi:uncharacterized membrane protein